VRPVLIGISSYARDQSDPPAFTLPCCYVDAVRAAGAVPLVLPPGESDPERLLDVVDGLILAGGGDISPEVYGGMAHETVYSVSAERDRFELDLARAALARPEVPLFCICRGLQILNVACGGTLHPHLPDVVGERVLHRLPPRRPGSHPVRIEPGSRVAEILEVTAAEVCSWHHQGVDRLGRGLKPVAWAEDGVIEAVDLEDHPWCVAVQWHPEMQADDPVQRRLFTAHVEAARERRTVGPLRTERTSP
jgi:putative glutamine amidotransferase